MTRWPRSLPCLPLLLVACLSPDLERTAGRATSCESRDALVARCTPAASGPVERTGHARAELSGAAHGIPLIGDKAVEGVSVEFGARLEEQGGRISVVLLSRVVDGRAVPYPSGQRPRMEPALPDARGEIAGRLRIPIDFAGFDGLSNDDNVRTTDVRLRFRLEAGSTLATAARAAGRIESMHAEGVRLAAFGSQVSLDLAGPIELSFDPAATTPSADSPAVRDCVARAMAECQTAEAETETETETDPEAETETDPEAETDPETVPEALPIYDVPGVMLVCDSDRADDVACWSNVFRQPLAGADLRGRLLHELAFELDGAARDLPSLEIEVRLLAGTDAGGAFVVEATRVFLPIGLALADGRCTDDGAAITCSVGYPAVALPAEAADWFVLELIGRDAGELAPDGTPACGRYPQRAAPFGYDDPSLSYGGALQVHRWSGPSCELDYQDLGLRPILDLAARVVVSAP